MGLQPQIGSDYSPVGQIYWYTLTQHQSEIRLMELKSLEDWVLEKQFKSVPNVVDVVSFGGTTREYQVRVDPDKLVSYGLNIGRWSSSCRNNVNAAAASSKRAAADQRARARAGQPASTISRRYGDQDAERHAAARQDIATVAQGPKIRLGQIGKAIHRATAR
jgi:cobalt-zinc-cadmium resistance protein CzcA